MSHGRAILQQAIHQLAVANDQLTLEEPPDKNVYISNKKLYVDESSLPSLNTAEKLLNGSVERLRKSGTEIYLPLALLARAIYHRWYLSLKPPEPEASLSVALQDLQEIYNIAQRNGMSLVLTDYHLESARLKLTVALRYHNSPTTGEKEIIQTAIQHISTAKQLIDDTGYKRRSPEVEYLERISALANS